MKGKTRIIALFLLLGAGPGAFGALAQATTPPQDPKPAKEPSKDQKVKPSPTPKPTPTEKKGADPNDDGGAQKGLQAKVKRCARGRLVKLDRKESKLEVGTMGETVVVRFTDETIIRVGTADGSLADLKEGALVTVYCAPNGPKDIATRIWIERQPPSPK